MMKHSLIQTVASDAGRYWVCECGATGVPVTSLVADGSVFWTAADRCESAHQRHQEQHLPQLVDRIRQSWEYPIAVYDYQWAGVGMRSREITLDYEEFNRLITAVFKTSGARPLAAPCDDDADASPEG